MRNDQSRLLKMKAETVLASFPLKTLTCLIVNNAPAGEHLFDTLHNVHHAALMYTVLGKKICKISDTENAVCSYTPSPEEEEILRMSQPYIRKLFMRYSGKNYKDYVLDSKLKLARQLIISDPEILIKDVAAKIGYEQLYFTTIFTKYFGMSPTKFKKSLTDYN